MRLVEHAPGVVYIEADDAVRSACPRCPWRGPAVIPGTAGWHAWIRLDLEQHTCTAPDQERKTP